MSTICIHSFRLIAVKSPLYDQLRHRVYILKKTPNTVTRFFTNAINLWL